MLSDLSFFIEQMPDIKLDGRDAFEDWMANVVHAYRLNRLSDSDMRYLTQVLKDNTKRPKPN